MATATPPLASRLARTDELGEAISLVLERGVAEGGLARAFAIYREGDRYRVLGLGQDDRARRIIEQAAEDPDTPIGSAVRTGDSTRLPDPTADAGELALLPLGTEAWGAVLLDAGADGSNEALRSIVADHAPMLDRIWMVRELRRRHRGVSAERDLLTTIVNSLPDPVVLTDASNNIILANDRADQLFSTQASDSEGRRRAVQLNNLLFSSFLTRSVISIQSAKPRELNLVDPSDGSDLLFEVLPTPVEQAGTEDAYLSILRNITDLKRAVTELETQFQRSRIAEERVREEWERLNATLENVGDPILVTDDHSNIILMNREAEALFESQRQDAAEGSTPARRLAVRANDTKFTGLMSDFLLQPEPRRVETLELQDPGDGGGFPAEVVSSKIINARGEPTAIVSVIHDLTQVVENERLARELRELNDELEERIRLATVELEERNRRLEWQSRELERASRLKSEFLASMSHELRTPINAVIGYTSLLREEIYGALTDKQKSGLDKVNIASQHLLELINDILDLSKIEAGKMPVHLEEVSLRQVVGELTEAIDPLAREKGLELVVDAEPDMPPLFTDRTKLKQILLNLLSNAIKFTSEGGVTLETRMTGKERVRIAVEDTGIGIKQEDLETVFADFRQVDQSPTREYGGTGLGLTITRKLVALLDGEIRVESTYGEGSIFTVELPLRLTPGTREEQVQRALAPDVTRTRESEDGEGDD
jgi:PAS domain S-box-containing protein